MSPFHRMFGAMGPSDGAKNYKHYLYGWPKYDVP